MVCDIKMGILACKNSMLFGTEMALGCTETLFLFGTLMAIIGTRFMFFIPSDCLVCRNTCIMLLNTTTTLSCEEMKCC